MPQQFYSTGAATPVGIPSVDTRVVGTAAVLFATGMVYLTRTVHTQQAMLFLVGGGIGVAPLYLYCRELASEASTIDHKVLLGARRRSLLIGREAVEIPGRQDDRDRAGEGTIEASRIGRERGHGRGQPASYRKLPSFSRVRSA